MPSRNRYARHVLSRLPELGAINYQVSSLIFPFTNQPWWRETTNHCCRSAISFSLFFLLIKWGSCETYHNTSKTHHCAQGVTECSSHRTVTLSGGSLLNRSSRGATIRHAFYGSSPHTLAIDWRGGNKTSKQQQTSNLWIVINASVNSLQVFAGALLHTLHLGMSDQVERFNGGL